MNSAGLRPRKVIVESCFIVFLFYSNLLMGEFTVKAGHGKSLLSAATNIFTFANFAIAVVTSVTGYVGFTCLRRSIEPIRNPPVQ